MTSESPPDVAGDAPASGGLGLRCARDGRMLEWLWREASLAAALAPGDDFARLVDVASAEKARRLLATIAARGAAFDWELNVACGAGLHAMRFSGVALAGDVVLIGTWADDAHAQRYAELAAIMNEMSVLQRDLAKTNAELRAEVARRERAETQLRELNRSLEGQVAQRSAALAERHAELESFAYSLSHELKTPLVTIAGYGGNLERDLRRRDLAAMAESIAEIRTAADDLKRHISDLLTLSRAARPAPATEAIALSELLAELTQAEQGRLTTLGARLAIAPRLPTVRAERKAMRRLFANLLDNALRYRREGSVPTIEIGAERVEGELWIYVRDNGSGIKPEYQERIFGLFERADARAGGTGAGLAICKRTVEAHGGRLWVESEAGRGSTFWVALPASVIVASD